MITLLKSRRAAAGLAVVLALLVALGVQSWRLRAAVSDARAQMARAESWRAALDDQVARQQEFERRDGAGEIGRAQHLLGADAMQLHVEGRKAHLRIDERDPAFDAAIRPHAGDADLADAGGVGTGGLDIERDEAEGALGHAHQARGAHAAPPHPACRPFRLCRSRIARPCLTSPAR